MQTAMRFLITAILWGHLSACTTVQKWWVSEADDTASRDKVTEQSASANERAPANYVNPLRVTEYCVVDNFSRVRDCFPSLTLCERAARGFGMCSGR